MARLFGKLSSAAVATGTTAKTIAQIKAPSTHGICVKNWGVSFDGTSPTEAKVKVELVKGATSGTGSTNNPVKTHGHTGSIAATGKDNFSGEPTGGTVVATHYVHPQGNYQINDEIVLNPDETLGIRTTTTSSRSACSSFWHEE